MSFIARGYVKSGNVCKDINCLHGSCVQVNELIPFQCQCDKGWKNLLNISFLGCGIPNCNFNLSCVKAVTSPAPAAPPVSFSSILDPCWLPVCGEGGDCRITNKTSLLPSYVCDCYKGYSNLFNSSSAICAPNCSLGADCSDLGISVGPGSAAPSESSNSSTSNPSAGFILSILKGNMFMMAFPSLLLLW
ncbi:hypothetical protein O6H91_Y326800 [Diphasiastrum complanatum]|nr:hypothetical protein O6H91_Y326800 [Diphasiastrum complanatum]